MEKKQVQEPAEVLTATAVMRLFEFKADDGQKRSAISTVILDPFGDPDFINVGISPRWDSVKGHIDYYGKKALRTVPEVEFNVEIRAVTYYSKKKKRDVTYAGVFAKSPFAPDYEIEFAVKERFSSVFRDLANPLLGITSIVDDDVPIASDEDDIGL
ncbi:MAG: hypothetical protein NC184_01970 [Roseburia sp.]|nr:hypothetical protein [Roseburia sp.]